MKRGTEIITVVLFALCARSTQAAGNPQTIFVPNQDADTITEYKTSDRGDVRPRITITGLSQPIAVAIEPDGDILVCQLFNSIQRFAADASGDATPISSLEGSDGTQDCVGIAVDSTGAILYVNESSPIDISKFSPGASGNSAPIAKITTQLTSAFGLTTDQENNIWVCDPDANAVYEFSPGANGSAAPIASLAGDATGLDAPSGIAISPDGEIYVANENASEVLVFAASSKGNVAPVRVISGETHLGATRLAFPVGVTFDKKGKLWVSDRGGYRVNQYGRLANGRAQPIRTIHGIQTGLQTPSLLAVH